MDVIFICEEVGKEEWERVRGEKRNLDKGQVLIHSNARDIKIYEIHFLSGIKLIC